MFFFRRTRADGAVQRALRAAVASHRPDALRALLASHGSRVFARALSDLSGRVIADALSMLMPSSRAEVFDRLSRAARHRVREVKGGLSLDSRRALLALPMSPLFLLLTVRRESQDRPESQEVLA